ncbi:uncharacterized protein LOC139931213 isoform X2 [Centroberyx gerrardi]|uniref:uncharacterized protein n=1 Tax=Centroberyx gerrardi TaxID=166262 RepID=UPI003AADEFAB
MSECNYAWLGLTVTSLALLISVCLNVIFCVLRRRAPIYRDTDAHLYPQAYQTERRSEDEGHDFHDHNHHELQENPIYGNINTDRDLQEVCYEMMTKQRTKDSTKPLEPDLNYASLDLNVAKKRKKKHRHQQGQTQDPSKLQNRLSQPLLQPTAPMAVFLEVEVEVEASLPSRNSSPMVSHNSIYLNSQQITQETEDRERERGINPEWEHMGWEGVRRREGGGSRAWKEEREWEGGTDRQDGGNVNVGTQIEEEATHDSTDHFISSFNHDNGQQN